MKTIGLLALLALGVAAHASFDMVLALDPAGGKIHRFDGDTGVYLGAITGVSNTAQKMVIDKTRGYVYVAEGSLGMSAFNIWTGTLVGSNWSPSPVSIALLPNGNVAMANGISQIVCFQDPVVAYNGGQLFSNSNAGASIVGLGMMSGSLFTLDNTADMLKRFDGATFSGASVANQSTSIGAGNYRDLSMGEGLAVLNDAGTFRVATPGVAGNYAISMTYAGAAALALYQDFAFAHPGTAYVSGVTSGGARIINRGTYNNGIAVMILRNTYTLPVTSDVADIQVFAAPEPGSFAFLGLGLVALLGRRRR